MGRDLYAFQVTLEGKLPCRDYWWQYGPLMPFYYGFWFLLTGVNLVSAKIGLDVLLFLCAFLTYLTLRIFVRPPTAFLFSLPFLGFDTGYTFNHIGGFPFLILSLFSLWSFFLTHRIRWCYVGTFALIGIALVKVSAGIASLFAFLGSLFLYNALSTPKNPKPALTAKHFFYILLIFSGVVFGIYGSLYSNLPLSWVDQCLWLSPSHRSPGIFPWGQSNIHSFSYFLKGRQLLWWSLFLGVFLLGLRSFRKKGFIALERQTLVGVFGSLPLFALGNAADYFVDGIAFRIHFWLFPMQVLFMGLVTEWPTPIFMKRTRILFLSAVFLVMLLIPIRNLQTTLPYRTPERYLDLPHGQVYLGGPLSILETVREGSRFILQNTKPGQEILAIPYDPIFCFLSDRRQAIRELDFYNKTGFSERRQEEIIVQLEAEKTPFIILSQTGNLGKDTRSGYLGRNHSRRLSRYLFEHYEKVKTFGTLKPDSPKRYPIVIFKRING